jgi:hypothetical protein
MAMADVPAKRIKITSMGFTLSNSDEKMYELAKGDIQVGIFNLSWDFTQGLTKEQWIKRREYELTKTIWLPSGRVIMPELGIT